MDEFYRSDLKDFARHGVLDAYELTDEDIAHLLEVWRWSVWTERDDVSDEVRAALATLQRHLANNHNIEVEYNTAMLLKETAEPLLYLRVLRDFPDAILYFICHPLRYLRAVWHSHRANVPPQRNTNGDPLGYPVERMPGKLRAPDLLRRHYWHRVSSYTFAERKRLDYWW